MHVPYTVRTSARAKAMRVAVYPDGRVIVTAPIRHSARLLERFIAKYARWIERQVMRAAGKPVIRIARSDIARLKREALSLAEARAAHFAEIYGVPHAKISIRAQRSRWGSCSAKGNLSFNYRIAALPPRLSDYIMVHEICHLIEMNHSKRFWDLVAREIPDHKTLRAELRSLAFTFV